MTLTGNFEFEGHATATVSDVGGVTMAGSGAPSDPGASVSDFTIEATIVAC